MTCTLPYFELRLHAVLKVHTEKDNEKRASVHDDKFRNLPYTLQANT